MANAEDYLIQAILGQQQDEYAANPLYSTGRKMEMTAPTYSNLMSPWEMLLAGGLQGLGGGVLTGIGQGQVDSKNKVNLQALNDFVGSSDPNRYDILAENPETAKYAPIAKLMAGMEQEKIDLAKKTTKPDIIELGVGNGLQQKFAYNPLTGEKIPLGESYAQFKPDAAGESTVIPESAKPLLASLVGKLAGKPADDPDVLAAIQNTKTANLTDSLLGKIGVGDRKTADLDFKKREQRIPGYEDIGEVPVLSATELKDLRRSVAETNKAKSLFDQIAEGKTDLNAIKGEDAQVNQARSAMLFNQFRGLTGSGAALSPSETNMINAMLPALASGDLIGALKAGVLGRDQREFARDMKKLMQDSVDVEMISYGKKSVAKDLSAYPRDSLTQLGIEPPTQPTPATLGTTPPTPAEALAEAKRRGLIK